MSEGLQGRIMHEARRDKNALMTAYAGDLAEMIEGLTARAERAEAALAELRTELDELKYAADAEYIMRARRGDYR